MAIDNQFGKGIGVAAGFDLGAQKPLDARIAVNTIAERDAHVENNRAYEGMIVFVDETKKNYQLINGAWQELAKAEQDRLDALEAMLSGGEGVEGANGVLGALQDAIDDVNDRLEEGGDIETRIAQAESDIDGLQGLVGKPVEGETPATGLHLALDTAKKELEQAILTEKGRAEGQEAAIRKELADEAAEIRGEMAAELGNYTVEGKEASGLRKEIEDAHKAMDQAMADIKKDLQDEIDDDVEVEKLRAEGQEAAIRQEMATEAQRVNKKIADDIATESALRVAEEQRIAGLVNSEAQRADAEEKRIVGLIESEAQTARAAEKANADEMTKQKDAAQEGTLANKIAANAAAIAQEAADRATAVSGEATARENADKALSDKIAVFEAGGAQDVAAKEVRLAAAEEDIARLDGAVDVEGSVKKQIKDAIDAVNGTAETLAGRVKANEDKLTGLEKDTVQASIDQAEADAKKYADDAITALVDSAPDAMNTLNELAKAISDHGDIYEAYIEEHATAMATMKSDLQKEIDDDVAAEAALRVAEEAKIRGEFAAADTALHTTISAEIDADVKVVADELTKQKDAAQEGTLANKIKAEATRADAAEKANKAAIDELIETVGHDVLNKGTVDEVEATGLIARIVANEAFVKAQPAIDKEQDRRLTELEAFKNAMNTESEGLDKRIDALEVSVNGREAAEGVEAVKSMDQKIADAEAAAKQHAEDKDAALHTAIKAEMASIVSSLAVEFKDNKLVVGLGSGVDFVTLAEREVEMVTKTDIDEIIAGLDTPAGE